MKKYDAIIVGAGPAGCQCARLLAKSGKEILLMEKSRDFSINSYSSGGAPLSILSDFNLPETIVDTFWDKLALYTSDDQHVWTSSTPMGVVLDFQKLREYLSDDAKQHGAELKLHSSYQAHTLSQNTIFTTVKNENGEALTLQSKVLVDATGSDRRVLAKKNQPKKQMTATGIEYHIEVSPKIFKEFSKTLSFFLGCKWMPQGYAWIFPQRPQILKVGVIRYFAKESPHDSFHHLLEQMMLKNLGSSTFPILEKHGKTLVYSYQHQDIHHHGPIIAIGDSISTLNPLAAEGIRHAMASAEIASHHILKFLNQNTPFDQYPKEMKTYYGFKWDLSELLMQKIYREKNETKINRFLKAFKSFSFNQLIDLAFSYKIGLAAKFYYHYLILSFKDLLKYDKTH